MTTKHPDDNAIQAYSLSDNYDALIGEHIKQCKLCSVKVIQYRAIFKGMEQQPAPVFDFNLTQTVMQQLPVKKQAYSIEKYFIYPLIAAAMVAIAVLIYPVKDYLTGMVAGLTPVLIGLIIITAGIISTWLCMDMYKKYKAKMDVLNFA